MTAPIEPFILLANPRTGTRMVCDALQSHKDVPYVIHEFNGSEEEFLETPYILTNHYKPWMGKYRTVHIFREDVRAGAKSMLNMSVRYPNQGAEELPELELQEVSAIRAINDANMAAVADYSISYEELTGGRQIVCIPTAAAAKLCNWLGLGYQVLTVRTLKAKPATGTTVPLADEWVEPGVYEFKVDIPQWATTRQARMRRTFEDLNRVNESLGSFELWEDDIYMGGQRPEMGKQYHTRIGQRIMWQTLSGSAYDSEGNRILTGKTMRIRLETNTAFYLQLYADFM